MMQAPLDDPLIISVFNYHTRLKRLLPYMRAHISEPLPLGDAARIACMEKTAFSRFFSQIVGITFHEFVQQWRIALAVEYMMASDSSLTSIAFAAGFQTMNTFERTFKKFTSVTPSEYRKQFLMGRGTEFCQEPLNSTQNPAVDCQQGDSTAADD